MAEIMQNYLIYHLFISIGSTMQVHV